MEVLHHARQLPIIEDLPNAEPSSSRSKPTWRQSASSLSVDRARSW
jgi:hypothetical protein